MTTTTGLSVLSGTHHPRLEIRGGILAPRVLQTRPGFARVALVATSATLLGGDAVDLRVDVGEGLRLELVDVAATVAYDGRGRSATWTAELTVGKGASLIWLGEPLVVAHGADVTRTLRLDVAAGGRALLREAVVLGRHGEDGGSLRCRTTVSYAASPLLVESLDLSPAGRARPGVLGGHRVLETLMAVGEPLPGWATDPVVPVGCDRFGLAGPGAMMRHLGHDRHASPLPALDVAAV